MKKRLSIHLIEGIEQSNSYQALEPIVCFNCGEIINRGDVFKRYGNKNGGRPGFRYSFCLKCVKEIEV